MQGLNGGGAVGTAEQALPYDPVAWSRRLDRARESRARILAARAAEKARSEAAAESPPDDILRLPEPVAEGPRVESFVEAVPTGHTTGSSAMRYLRLALGVAVGLAGGCAVVMLFAG